ncbi:hypothetical protein [uncultured Nocardioides sp.]|uniref:hypothetical protein n=1 Tax=uncultured Nocardioides sp. TaxID=198441 RepID=UPI002621D330|nr:hypothetical protein [uncultured Nocardioides sp.]
MAVTGQGTEPVVDPLERAVAAAQQTEPAGWSVLADDVMRRARALRRHEQPVLADLRPDGSRTVVSTRVLTDLLRVGLTEEASYTPDDLTFVVEGERLVSVGVSLVAAFGVDLVRTADEVRARVLRELDELVPLSKASGQQVAVDVTVVDVVDGDPRRV